MSTYMIQKIQNNPQKTVEHTEYQYNDKGYQAVRERIQKDDEQMQKLFGKKLKRLFEYRYYRYDEENDTWVKQL
jgi:hypothetical protein